MGTAEILADGTTKVASGRVMNPRPGEPRQIALPQRRGKKELRACFSQQCQGEQLIHEELMMGKVRVKGTNRYLREKDLRQETDERREPEMEAY